MKILAIETSCDETAASVVENGVKVLSNVVATSAQIHIATGGIIPENAARLQVEYIISIIQKSLVDAFPNDKNIKSQISNIDALAVTYGPGLVGSLLVGVETAKTLSMIWHKPLIPINHLVAHIYANWIDTDKRKEMSDKRRRSVKSYLPHTKHQPPTFPAIALVVSGGHTDFVLMRDHGQVKWLGGTRDDAAGECFDKCARLLDLPYPGGPSISAEAAKYEIGPARIVTQSVAGGNTKYEMKLFPRPMINSNDLDFSFSGLKTAVYNHLQIEHKNISRAQIAAEVQEAIVDVLVKKSIDAMEKYKPKSFLLSGGVAANKRLREKFINETQNRQLELSLHIPVPSLCTDNAAVIASCAYFNNSPIPWKEIAVNPQLEIAS